MEIRLLFVGDSNARNLMRVWQRELPSRHTNLVCRFIGRGGARLLYDNGASFQRRYLQSIINFRPHLVFVWIAGNDLCQDMRYGNMLMIDNATYVFHDYIALCNAISAGISPMGRLVMMPQFPRCTLRNMMTQWEFFCQVRSFNIRFRRRNMGANRVYQMSGMFRIDGDHLCEDGVHLSYISYWSICLDLFEQYVVPLYDY